MTFPPSPIEFPDLHADPSDPVAMAQLLRDLSRFRISRLFMSEAVEVSADYTLRPEEDRVVLAAGGGGGITVTLPDVENADAVEYVFKKVDAGGTVTVAAAAGDTIDGSATVALTVEDDFVRLVSNGSSWYITGCKLDGGSTTVVLPTGSKAEGTEVLSGGTWHEVPGTVPTVPYRLWWSIETQTGIIRQSHTDTGSPSATDGLRPLASHMIDMAANESFFFGSTVATDRVNWLTQEHS